VSLCPSRSWPDVITAEFVRSAAQPDAEVPIRLPQQSKNTRLEDTTYRPALAPPLLHACYEITALPPVARRGADTDLCHSLHTRWCKMRELNGLPATVSQFPIKDRIKGVNYYYIGADICAGTAQSSGLSFVLHCWLNKTIWESSCVSDSGGRIEGYICVWRETGVQECTYLQATQFAILIGSFYVQTALLLLRVLDLLDIPPPRCCWW